MQAAILNEKLAPSDKSRRAAQPDTPVPGHGLRATGRTDHNRRNRLAAENRGYCCGTRTGAGGVRLADAALEKTGFNLTLLKNTNQFNINPMLEVMMPADFGGFGLPAGSKVLDKNYEMGIAHRNWYAADLPECEFDGELISHLRLAHIHFEFELRATATQQPTGLQSSTGADDDLIFAMFGGQPGSDTPGSIAGDLRLRTVGIEQASAHVRIGCGEQPLHAVSTDTLMAVAHAARGPREIVGSMHAIDQQEVIATGHGLDEGNGGHSFSGSPRAAMRANVGDCRKRCISASCSLRVASTLNRMRYWWSVRLTCTVCMAFCSSSKISLTAEITPSASAPTASYACSIGFRPKRSSSTASIMRASRISTVAKSAGR